jgi:hypothetical protein
VDFFHLSEVFSAKQNVLKQGLISFLPASDTQQKIKQIKDKPFTPEKKVFDTLESSSSKKYSSLLFKRHHTLALR